MKKAPIEIIEEAVERFKASGGIIIYGTYNIDVFSRDHWKLIKYEGYAPLACPLAAVLNGQPITTDAIGSFAAEARKLLGVEDDPPWVDAFVEGFDSADPSHARQAAQRSLATPSTIQPTNKGEESWKTFPSRSSEPS
jgi:hypothetical protein